MRYGSRYRSGARRTVVAVIAASAALVVTGCQGDDGGDGAGSGTVAGSSSGAASASVSPSGSAGGGASEPGKGGASTSASASASAPSGSVGGAVKACAAAGLEAAAHQAADRPDGTGTGAAVVGFTNVSGASCVLSGHPSVAGAGNGSPEHNSPLAVTHTGSASSVRVAPGGTAWVKLTFAQVQGEGDGYCASGADPVVYPTLVVGLPDAGEHQVALNDGVFAECDDTVTVTAVSLAKPS
ncbi:DUF4232 domain-containing protein [Streptomyces sp. NPDC087903]|uniref:DUF4232 domain-containing protein n=1 Tax=Streptomyces sp. NPDC087903 TaxID=3365819 RepID=UPI0037F687D2